jgi:tetratricopeptide (TPR) repeat protein
MMNWITLLQAQQADFIERLKSGCLLHCKNIGQHSELTIISGDKLLQLRAFCWLMADKYKITSVVRNVFINNLKGKLGEEVVKIRLENFITEVDYEERLGGDGKVDFTLNSNPSFGIQVKARHDKIDTVKWSITKEEVEKNSLVICILIQEEVNEAQSEYHLILAGFLPTYMIKMNDDRVSLGIDSLLYAGGLRSYLSNLTTFPSLEEIEDKEIPNLEPEHNTNNTKQTEEYIKSQIVNLIIDYFIIANTYLKEGNYQDAYVNYNQVLKLEPNLSEALLNRSYALRQIGDIPGANNDLNRAILINPVDYNLYFQRGEFHYEIGDIQGAIEDLNLGIKINPNNAYALFRRGTFFWEVGENEAAIEDYTRSIVINKNFADPYLNRGLIRYHCIRNTQEAIEDFTQAISINPKCIDAYYWRGAARYDKRIDKGSIIDFTQVIKLNPKHYLAYVRRGIVFAEVEEYQKALEDFDSALKIEPNFAEAYENRGSVYHQLGHMPFAIRDLRKAANFYENQNQNEGYQRVIEKLKEIYELQDFI